MPHFRTWDDIYYDYHGTLDGVTAQPDDTFDFTMSGETLEYDAHVVEPASVVNDGIASAGADTLPDAPADDLADAYVDGFDFLI